MKQFRRVYLAAYNAAMCVGWAAVCASMGRAAAQRKSLSEIGKVGRPLVKWLLRASVLEVIHAATGLVKSPLGTTAIQIMGRLFIFTASIEGTGAEAVGASPWPAELFTAWAASEVIRYSYYMANLVTTAPPRALTWLRYTGFIALYPLGFAGEIGCMITSLPAFRETGRWSVALPNAANFAFDYPGFVTGLLCTVYPAAAATMFSYMLRQRARALA